MPRRSTPLLAFALILACATSRTLAAQEPARSSAPTAAATPATSIAARTAGMEKRDGFIPLYLDRRTGRIALEIPRDSLRVLFFLELATGLGSNPIGLDRGSDGASHIARFDRSGEHVLVVLENWKYRSSARDNPAHLRTVAEAFAPSTMAALPLLAEERGRLLVDATDFFLRDWLDVAGTLARSNEGSYALARDRSSIHEQYTKAFPENTEVDVSLTFAAQGRPGEIVASVVPDGRAFTLRQHASLMKLPDDGYRPRVLDPRVGFGGITFKDYAQPIQSPLEVRWIARHRLQRADPADPASPIRNPIVYYIDRGIPEPVRTATKEGVSWWVRAFDQAGLTGGFRVEDLPEGVDPLDSRYNVVQWENRNERGWSIGGSLDDPRTGEILKGMARLDSHRARTDYNLYAGLMGADAAAADTAFVLARVRQVSAHEVGHTLGMAHNYIASTYERASVMDYPPPRVRLDGSGHIDISAAYGVGPGAYDVWAIHWAYGTFPPASEADSLRALVADGLRKGFLFLSDADARPEFASDPRVNLWDDAASADEFMKHQMAVRRVAIARFGERNIRPGEPIALLQERFVPIYFFHRFAINALAKTIGGMEYSNAVRGDALQATRPIAGDRQRRALTTLAAALQPAELDIPDTVLTLLAPRPFSYGPYVELFGSRTRPAFDELGAARTLAQMIVDAVLQRERAGRLVQFAGHGRDPLTLAETIDSLAAATWRERPAAAPKVAALQRVTQRALADRLLSLAADRNAAPEARAIADYKIAQLRDQARRRAVRVGSEAERAHWAALAGDLTRWMERRELPAPTPALVAPPGDPFGVEP
ncbi:MAG: zinc-dependent metalloprotease [Gemmatimonadota bacterium]|nr:zinc-dependent metalloprotease [Gemmatimonadota bacterium]